MTPELVGWQILTAFVILGGDLWYWVDRWEARSYAKALPIIEAELNKFRSRTPVGSTFVSAADSDPPPTAADTQGTGGEPPAGVAVEAPPVPSTARGGVGSRPAPPRVHFVFPPHAPAGAGPVHPPTPASVGLQVRRPPELGGWR